MDSALKLTRTTPPVDAAPTSSAAAARTATMPARRQFLIVAKHRTEREHGQAAAPTNGERPPVSPQGYRNDPVHCLRQIVESIPDSPA